MVLMNTTIQGDVKQHGHVDHPLSMLVGPHGPGQPTMVTITIPSVGVCLYSWWAYNRRCIIKPLQRLGLWKMVADGGRFSLHKFSPFSLPPSLPYNGNSNLLSRPCSFFFSPTLNSNSVEGLSPAHFVVGQTLFVHSCF